MSFVFRGFGPSTFSPLDKVANRLIPRSTPTSSWLSQDFGDSSSSTEMETYQWSAFRDTVADDPLIQARTKGIGVLTADQIRKFAALGPTARASGVDIDVRRDHPHAAYDRLDWDVVLESDGDIFAKIMVRIREMFESVRIIRQCVSQLEKLSGPIDANPTEVKPGEGIGHYEPTNVHVGRVIDSRGRY